MSTEEARTELINSLQKLDPAQMSTAHRRQFRINGMKFLEYLLSLHTAVDNSRKNAIKESYFQHQASTEYRLNL